MSRELFLNENCSVIHQTRFILIFYENFHANFPFSQKTWYYFTILSVKLRWDCGNFCC